MHLLCWEACVVEAIRLPMHLHPSCHQIRETTNLEPYGRCRARLSYGVVYEAVCKLDLPNRQRSLVHLFPKQIIRSMLSACLSPLLSPAYSVQVDTHSRSDRWVCR